MNKKKKTFLAVIPARSGSKGVKDKNIRSFYGKPLMYYTLAEAKKAKGIDRIIVSTDSPRYAQIARRYGGEVPFLRPERLAGDTSPIPETLVHLVEKLEQDEGYQPDYVMMLQATSPLRTAKDIERCIDLAVKHDCDGVLSVCSTEQLLYTITDGKLKLLYNKAWWRKTNRQTLPATYKLNGAAVYIIKRETLLKNRSLLKGKIMPYVMKKWQSVDLDTEEDFRLAELLYKNRRIFSK